jgi:hypothetical protein
MEPPAPVTSTVWPEMSSDKTLDVELHRIAPQQVFELDLARTGRRPGAAIRRGAASVMRLRPSLGRLQEHVTPPRRALAQSPSSAVWTPAAPRPPLTDHPGRPILAPPARIGLFPTSTGDTIPAACQWPEPLSVRKASAASLQCEPTISSGRSPCDTVWCAPTGFASRHGQRPDRTSTSSGCSTNTDRGRVGECLASASTAANTRPPNNTPAPSWRNSGKPM